MNSLWLNEKISLREASRRLNTNHNTFSRWAKAYLYKNNSNNTIMVHIRKLREKIERQPRNPQHIKTVWGVGYKFEL